ncbi:flagellar biosynthetic protein FliO [Petroclostridium xylanilyticum]|uniref:flagellar biosynthetic protein FliO n=1 Tax=Petroclostridium xylanilyticum TaxID=1792311 RepID=UPI000B98BA29|nr:flagellar biosynthetic protein FliO [Petroclostridium xylanilyticum]
MGKEFSMPSGFEVFMNILFGLVVFASLLFLAYVSTRLIGQKAAAAMKSKHMKVIDSITLGIDKNIYLIQVGKKFILVAASGKTLQYLTDVELNDFEDTTEEINQQFKFSDIFEKYLNKVVFKKGQTFHLSNQPRDEKNDSIPQNIIKIKNSFEKLKVNRKGGDENINV